MAIVHVMDHPLVAHKMTILRDKSTSVKDFRELVSEIGMLITYYITAELTNSVYGMTFIYGWAAFSVCSPVFAILTWMTKEKGVLGKIISFGILVVTLTVSMVVFDGPRVYDIVIMHVLAYFLFIHKVKR